VAINASILIPFDDVTAVVAVYVVALYVVAAPSERNLLKLYDIVII
jgi:hypothetical protein